MLCNLYANIGEKIKKLAKGIFIFESIGAVITGIVQIVISIELESKVLCLYGLLTLVCGPIVAWISSWILYAFGELVEDVHAIRFLNNQEALNRIAKNVKLIAEKEEKQAKCQEGTISLKTESVSKCEIVDEEGELDQCEKQMRLTELREKLSYALRYQTDDGIINYLSCFENETVQEILKNPKHLIREKIELILTEL